MSFPTAENKRFQGRCQDVGFRATPELHGAVRIRLCENATVCWVEAVVRALPLLPRSRPLNPVTHPWASFALLLAVLTLVL